MMRSLGRFCARHHWLVFALWILAVVAAGVMAKQVGGETDNNFTIPGTDSQAALDILDKDFPSLAGTSADVVFQSPEGATVAGDKNSVEETITNLKAIPNVTSVSDPFSTETQLLHSQTSTDGTIAYVTVAFTDSAAELPTDTFDKIEEAAKPAVDAGLNVQFGGQLVDAQNPPTSTLSTHADTIGLAIALVLLLLVFRSLFVAVLPIINAILGVALAGSLIVIAEGSLTIPQVGPILGSMLGLGVGVDYSLFILTRGLGELEDGRDPVDAMGTALATAGKAVIFAGLTICMASVALLVIGIPMVGQMGLVAAFYVFISVLAAMTLVPALGGMVGHRLLDWKIGKAVSMNRPATSGMFAGLAKAVTRHPAMLAFGAVLVLLVLASPARDLQTGWVGDEADPTDMTQRQAYDLLTEGFGPGVNGELLVVVETGTVVPEYEAQVAAAALELQADIAKTDGVETASLPFPNSTSDPTAFAIEVQPTTGPNNPATGELVRTLRDTTIPGALGDTTIEGGAHVGGVTATIIDLTDTINAALPSFIALVLVGAFLLLLLVFRSVLVPTTAVVMNLLSIGATFGMLVAVFQWGWGKNIIGLSIDVDIVAFVPLMVFAIVFGLSMDYEVFLMSRMREEFLKGGDPTVAAENSVSITGRVILSAALVMFSVFASFVTNPSPTVKMIGLGLALGVLVDATLVRLVLVPSIMRLLGHAGWWLPKWLDHVMPNISIEAPKDDAESDREKVSA